MRFGEAVVVGLAALAVAGPASGATLEVETDTDEFAKNSSTCTLREAVEAARTNKAFGGCPKGSSSKGDTIELPGDVVLSIAGDSDTNADGDLDYDKGGKLTIAGGEDIFDPARVSAAGGWSDRILEVRHEQVKLDNLEITDGDTVGDANSSGGAIRATSGAKLTLTRVALHDNAGGNRGGAVACEGCKSLKLIDKFNIEDNSVTGVGAQGGAIWSNAPLMLAGKPNGAPLPGQGATIFNNDAVPQVPQGANGGGAIYAADDLTIRKTRISGNSAGTGPGGAIRSTGNKVEITDSSIAANSADGSGGGIDVASDSAKVEIRRSAITANTANPNVAGHATGGGMRSAAKRNILIDSMVQNNTANPASGGLGKGGGLALDDGDGGGVELTRLVRTSVNNNTVTGGSQQKGGGIYATSHLETLNTTIASNTSFGAGGEGGGLQLEPASGGDDPSALIDFTTFSANEAFSLPSALFVQGEASLRGSIIDETGGVACSAIPAGAISSRRYNVQNGTDPDCGIDAPTDTHEEPLLGSHAENGTRPVGYLAGQVPRTVAFTADVSSALGLVPKDRCFPREDARGAARPEAPQARCDAGAIERSSCHGEYVVGASSFVGSKGDDDYVAGSGDNVVLGQGGDDTIDTGDGEDAICAGDGDDRVISGGDPDALLGQGGIDILDARDGEADQKIDCGPGKNSKEKAKVDQIDPQPISC